jgi:ribosomal protein S27AE
MPGHLAKLVHVAQSLVVGLLLVTAFAFAILYRWGPAWLSVVALAGAVICSLLAIYGVIFSTSHRIKKQSLELSSKIFEVWPDESRLHQILLDFHGLKWKITFEKPQSRFDSVGEKVWVEGPKCPRCESDLGSGNVGVVVRRTKLWCSRCGFSTTLPPWQNVHSMSETLRKRICSSGRASLTA